MKTPVKWKWRISRAIRTRGHPSTPALADTHPDVLGLHSGKRWTSRRRELMGVRARWNTRLSAPRIN